MNNPNNIKWVGEEDICRWKGMHRDEWVKVVGTDDDLAVDQEDLVIIGGTVYCDSTQVFLDYLKNVNDNDGNLDSIIEELTKVKPLDQLKFDVDINLLREFHSDLDAYYEEVQRRSV